MFEIRPNGNFTRKAADICTLRARFEGSGPKSRCPAPPTRTPAAPPPFGLPQHRLSPFTRALLGPPQQVNQQRRVAQAPAACALAAMLLRRHSVLALSVRTTSFAATAPEQQGGMAWRVCLQQRSEQDQEQEQENYPIRK